MSAMSIFAMAMVICLFGGYVDSPGEWRISTAVWTILQTFARDPEPTKRRS
jgi:hypothetical protein